MNCPKCGHDKSDVTDSRPDDAIIRRKRKCRGCRHIWRTLEINESPEQCSRDAVRLSAQFDALRGHLAAAVRIMDGKE